MKRSSEVKFVGLANQRLVSTLAKNLTNMEHFTRWDAVSFILKGFLFVCFSTSCSLSSHVFIVQLEKLALAAEQQQQGGEVRARASFLVLTQTLLLSLGELNETKHMLAAQRVYLLLERPLLELIRNSSSSPVTPPSSFKLSSIYPTERRLTKSLCCSRRQSLMSASLSPSLQH